MSSDLEKFLQQAAERLAQKTGSRQPAPRQRTGPAGGARPQSTHPSTQPFEQPPASRRVAPVAEIIDAEVLDEDERRTRALRAAGPDPFSSIDTRPALAQTISQADERMGEHLQHAFAHELAHLPTSSHPLMGLGEANQTDQATEVYSRKQFDNPLVAMLRSPDTLRAAFIVGEIFRRRV